MSEEKELKLACLHQAGGDLDHAQRLFDWVSGSVRATPDSEAAEVSAPKQDKPQQPFNYQHPSKYGTDVPRRCYLEELTPEERAIRDLVDTVERLGAHPLLTATVIQLMKAGEDLADWVDIGLRDKAIAALSPGNDLGLLDDGQQETSPVQSASDQDKAAQEPPGYHWWFGGPSPIRHGDVVEVQYRGGGMPSTFVEDSFVPKDTWSHRNDDKDIILYRVISDAERIEDVSEPLATTELSEGFIPWSGGECPVDGSTLVNVKLASGIYGRHQMNRYANSLNWAHGDGFDSIVAYRIITDVERTSDESQASSTEAGEVTEAVPPLTTFGLHEELRAAGFAPIGNPEDDGPIYWEREPSAEAERTEVDSPPTKQDRVEPLPSGIQFRVDGGPLQTTGQEPAAFAPVNAIEDPETDALMWANGFQTDAKSKAEPEQDKRPFWMFAKKVDA